MTNRVVVPAGKGRAVSIAAGQCFRVVDVEGGQVADAFAFCADNPSEYLSAEHTRVGLSRLFPEVGQSFLTNRRRPILAFVEDGSPGIHDMLCAACDPTRYSTLGFDGWHASCEENLRNAMLALGHANVEIPQPVNLFMNTPVLDDGQTIGWAEAQTRAGDFVELLAELDCIVCVSACPQDLNPINGRQPTAVAIELR
jgi:uncharacterized protein